MGRGPLTTVVDSLLQDLKQGVKEKRSLLQNLWPGIVGSSLAPHTKGALQRDGTLCVWVDNSVRANELRIRYQGTILKRAQGALGEEAVQKIVFRVGEIH